MGAFIIKNVSGNIQFFAAGGRDFRIYPGYTESVDDKFRSDNVIRYLVKKGVLQVIDPSGEPEKPSKPRSAKPAKTTVKAEKKVAAAAVEPQQPEKEEVSEPETPKTEEVGNGDDILDCQCSGLTQSGSRCRRRVKVTRAEYEAAGEKVYCPTHQE